MSTYELVESATGTADANGRAVATLGPLRAFEQWEINGVTIANTSTVLEPKVEIFKGQIARSNLKGGSYSGRFTSGPADETLRNGERLIAEWTGCDVGSTSTITISGTSKR